MVREGLKIVIQQSFKICTISSFTYQLTIKFTNKEIFLTTDHNTTIARQEIVP